MAYDNDFNGGWTFNDYADDAAVESLQARRKLTGKIHRATNGGEAVCAPGKAYDDTRRILTTHDDDAVTCKVCRKALGLA